MKRLLPLLALIVFAASLSAEKCPNCPALVFKENKGQWQNNVLFKAEVKNGAVFLEKDALSFNLFDVQDMLCARGGPHKPAGCTGKNYDVSFHAFKIKLKNADSGVLASGADAISEYFNYFIGNNKSSWTSNVLGYHEISYSNLYRGIDFKITSQQNALKYLFERNNHADVAQLQLSFEGTDGLFIDKDGNLHIKTSVGDLIDLKPYAYQMSEGKEKEVPCQFMLSKNVLTYRFPEGFNPNEKLFVDPTLVFSTYSGSTADNFGHTATYDLNGNAYSAGTVFGVGYPMVTGHYVMSYVGGPTIFFSSGGSYPGDDMAITKYSADGTQRIFSTYLGGNGQDMPHSLVVSSTNQLYLLGTTDCPDYPVTATAYDTSFNGGPDPGVWDGIAAHYARGSDLIISRLSEDGAQLLSSTYVGGSGNDGVLYRAGQSYASPGFLRHNYADEVRSEIEIDRNNHVYVVSCTRSVNFPRTAGTFQSAFGGGTDACVFKMDTGLSTMQWSTTFGGAEDDAAYSVAIDQHDNLFIAGGTISNDFPVSNNTYQPGFGGGSCDGFIVHIDKTGQTKIASTYFGYSNYDQIYFVDLDKADNVYVLGQADNAGSNFIRNAVYNRSNGGQFISKFNEALDTLQWSTSWGRGLGVSDISPTAFLVDNCNHIYACGWGSQGVNNIVGAGGGTTGLDVTANAYKSTTDGQDFYLMIMKGDASALDYATFMGGGISEEHVDGGTSRFSKRGVVYQAVCAGCGSNDDFPTTSGAVSSTNNSNNCNNAIFKFDMDYHPCYPQFSSAETGCIGYPVALPI